MTLHRRRLLTHLGAHLAALAGGTALAAPAVRAAAPRQVSIGYAICRTGPFAAPAQITQEPTYILWAEQVNAAGGLDVQGRHLPVELIGLDDHSDPEVSVQAYLELMTRRKVDLVLAPWGTRMTSAVAPLANKYGYPLLAPTASSRRLVDMNLPYYFSALQQGDDMMAALVGLLVDRKAKRLAVLHAEDPFGMETLKALQLALRGKPVELLPLRGYAPGTVDFSPALAGFMQQQPDAFVGLSYPADTLHLTEQSRRLGFNPRFFYTSVGTAYPSYLQKFGAAAHGVLGMGSWNPRSSPGARAYQQAHVQRFNKQPDRWASGHTYAALQTLQAAVQHTGLDRRGIRNFIASQGADTILGPMRFRRGELASIPGMVGQWQNGEFEVVWPPARATAAPIADKPHWPVG
jgi:branched-chain amino acid transport system substrate-binding protein